MKIVADAQIPYIYDYFNQYGELILKPGRSIQASDVQNADLLLVRSVTPVNANLLAQSSVKWVGSVTAGMDHLDIPYLNSAGITYSVASGFNAPPVADYVVSMVAICQSRGYLLGKGLKAAVIGVGQVGKLVAHQLDILGFEVTLCDPLRHQQDPNFTSITINDIQDMDLVSLHVPLTHQGPYATYHFFTESVLKRQKPGCVVINASRGAVIKTELLLKYQQDVHWCLDVWEHEPCVQKEALNAALIATPHIAGYSRQGKRRGIHLLYEQACRLSIIKPHIEKDVHIPHHMYYLSNAITSWHQVLANLFDFYQYSNEVKAKLLKIKNQEREFVFDELRRIFPSRNEFAYSGLSGGNLPLDDRHILKRLGFSLQ